MPPHGPDGRLFLCDNLGESQTHPDI